MSGKDMPLSERPKEKLLFYGADALSNAELLSLVIKTGAAGKSAIEIADDTLSYVRENGSYLDAVDVRELAEVYGVSDSNACSIVAAMELGKRIAADRAYRQQIRVDDSSLIADLVMEQLANEKREHFIAFFLNTKLRLESQYTVSIGSIDSSLVHPREVFSPAVKRGAAAVIVAHNHPSGDPTPSPEDISTTKRLVEASKILGIRLLDHVIVGRNKAVSMRAEGLVEF